MSKSKGSVEIGSSSVQEYPDGRTYDPNEVRDITQRWVDNHMKRRESEFTRAAECTIFCGTWNVNAKKQEGGLNEWLLPPNQSNADIYAIGFQEIVDLNAMNVALNSNNTQQRAQFWEERIAESLDSTGVKYQLIGEKYLVGLLLCVYIKESLVNSVRDIRATSLGVGIMGMMGNKGGVSVRFSLFDSTICFICAHLAAHRENVAGRNTDFKNIYEKSLFVSESVGSGTGMSNNNNNNGPEMSSTNNPSVLLDSVVMPRQGATRYIDQNLMIAEHDLVFWVGDLNYRIDYFYTTEEVFQKIQANDLESLRLHDQLNIERQQGRVFAGFSEGLLTFQPTYKYQPGTDVYETRAEKKLRAPAWCDRVLWKTASKDLIVQLNTYTRANLIPSDHKPVFANFTCPLKQVVESKEKVIFQELLTLLKRYASSTRPVVDIQGLKIQLDKVVYEVPRECMVEMKNTGDTIAYWHFVKKIDDTAYSKRWIALDKTSGLLLPNESVKIGVTITVDKYTARDLNLGKDSLQDMLILRVENCPDVYVDIKAEYERSCYGMALEELVYTLQPVASLALPSSNFEEYIELQRQQYQQLQQQQAQGIHDNNNNNKLSIPKELWRLVDALWSGNALKEKDLFHVPGDRHEIVAIRYAIDHGTDFPICSPHSLVDCLISFLDALPRPLIPWELYPIGEIDNSNLRFLSRKFLEDLPPLNYNTLVYMLSFLREVLADESYNRCNADSLSAVCVQCMTDYINENNTEVFENDPFHMILSNEDKERRIAGQNNVMQILKYLLTTSSL